MPWLLIKNFEAMNKGVLIVGGTALAGAIVVGLSLANDKAKGELIDFEVLSSKFNGIVNAKFQVIMSICFKNPSNTEQKLKALGVQFLYKGTEIGVLAIENDIILPPNSTTPVNATLNIPFTLLPALIVAVQKKQYDIDCKGAVFFYTSTLGIYVQVPIEEKFNALETVKSVLLSYV